MSDVVPGDFREWFRGFFAWRLRKGFPKSFHGQQLNLVGDFVKL